jgi:hypothetical protein
MDRVMTDLKRSERFGYNFAAKIVRGKPRRRLVGRCSQHLFVLFAHPRDTHFVTHWRVNLVSHCRGVHGTRAGEGQDDEV